MLRADLLLLFRSSEVTLAERMGDRGSPIGAGRPNEGMDGIVSSCRLGPAGTVGVGAASS